MRRGVLPSFARNWDLCSKGGNDHEKGLLGGGVQIMADEAAVKAYGELAMPALQSFGGRFLTRSMSQVEAHEAGLQLRTVVVEFDSYDTALAARNSEAYQKALQALGSGAERDFCIVEGVQSPSKLGSRSQAAFDSHVQTRTPRPLQPFKARSSEARLFKTHAGGDLR